MASPAVERRAADHSYPSPFDETDELLARQREPRFYCQITEGHVSFEHIAKAWWLGHSAGPREPADRHQETDEERDTRRVSVYLEHLAWVKFAEDHQDILKSYWSSNPWAACALTGDGWVHSVMNTTNADLVKYEADIHQICRDAHRTFEKAAAWRPPTGRPTPGPASPKGPSRTERSLRKAWNDLQEVGDMLYDVLARVIYTAQIIEDPGISPEKRIEALDALRKLWTAVRSSVNGMIQRQARFEYFEGVGLGAVIIIPALAFAGAMAASHGGDHFSDPAAFTAAIIGGAAGAVISVTQRMTATQRTENAARSTTNALVLDFAAPKYQKVALGALRPLVGAVFGAVICFAVLGGLLAVEARSGKDASIALAFFAVAGFAAGFSERFATDVLDRATRAVTAPAREEAPGP